MKINNRVVKHFFVTATFPSGRTVSGKCNALFGGVSGVRLPTICLYQEEDDLNVTHVTVAQTESIHVIPVYETNHR
ncbi:hypothetical protein MXF20_15480 [Pantoea dispersa]|uniref:hypothetical protein n=1 Tax=Pantoea dispersa TaxID=59814 RepID=UPI002DBC3AC4|nr:hypothetical protein [Pantoea dispersa]MEB5973480.1 hypothetical protein [Pantoea dispersa]